MSGPTWFACLTPAGTAAIATLALSGPDAWKVARALFRPATGALPDRPDAGRFWFGRLGEAAGAADEVILAVPRTEPVPWVEWHTHGGTQVVAWARELIRPHGVTVVSWPEFVGHALGDPLRARALAELAQARTVRTAGVLLDQYHGAFARAVEAIQTALASGDKPAAERLLDDLARYAGVGVHLVAPFRVVVAGAPNVGKSSLVNALAGYQRSVVTAIPGTTRDVVTTTLALDGWPVEVADTAGVRATRDELERAGIDRTAAAMADADLCLWLLDASAEAPLPPPSDLPSAGLLLAINKVDGPAGWDLGRFPDAPRLSARTGEGLPGLVAPVVARLVPEAPPAGAAVPFTVGLAAGVRRAREALARGGPVDFGGDPSAAP